MITTTVTRFSRNPSTTNPTGVYLLIELSKKLTFLFPNVLVEKLKHLKGGMDFKPQSATEMKSSVWVQNARSSAFDVPYI